MTSPTVPAARLAELTSHRAPSTVDEAFDAACSAIVTAVGQQALLEATDVFVAVLRGASADVWRLFGLPPGQIPDEQLVRSVVWASEEPADTVVVVRRFQGLDPVGRDAFGLRFFLEREGERAWAVLHFLEVGTTGEPPFPKTRIGPTPPDRAWLGVRPDRPVHLWN